MRYRTQTRGGHRNRHKESWDKTWARMVVWGSEGINRIRKAEEQNGGIPLSSDDADWVAGGRDELADMAEALRAEQARAQIAAAKALESAKPSIELPAVRKFKQEPDVNPAAARALKTLEASKPSIELPAVRKFKR